MFVLVKREIRDHIVFFIAAVLTAAIAIGVLISAAGDRRYADWEDALMLADFLAAVAVLLGVFGMGAVQMYTDRTRRISAFVSTLPVSRSRILLAKIAAGVLAILTVLVPLLATVTILTQLYSPPIPVYDTMIVEVFTGAFLLVFACYCIGLQVGWNSGRLGPALAGLGLTCILASLVVIKGPGPEIALVLVLFIVASLIRTWHLFTSTSL
ncbi:MAG: hypothetical protein ACYSWO_03545 [Planctomycetota bacterium]|jgi:ABC-type transport system involved in multi-copper enzyme maturation permease subunit